MNKYWLSVFIATFFEVIWVTGLKYSTSIIEWIATIICILLTFVLLTFANKKLPIGTTYTVFTGIGTVGTLLIDVIFFNQEVTLLKLLFIVLLIIGVIGLKMLTSSEELSLQREEK